jgi:hypothetical protein
VSRILRVNAPAVVGEIIDGEAVIMDLGSGHYFSTQGSGAEVWRAIEGGCDRAGVAVVLAERYEGDRAELNLAADRFIEELLAKGLIVEAERATDAPLPPVLPSPVAGQPRHVFVAPVLDSYSDMEDLLLLDPIHDVNEAGWPMAKAPETPETDVL